LSCPALRAIPLVDVRAQHAALAPEIEAALSEVCHRGDFILGRAVDEFEAAFAAYLGVRHVVGVASGTDALHLAMRALGIGPGDEVLVPANTFIATCQAVSYAGATPVLVDCEESTAVLDVALAAGAVTARTRAVIPVHLYGQPADMDGVRALASAHRLSVIEDAAQAHGACWRGRRCGALGTVAAFSFYPAKNLGAYGDGGALATDDAALAEEARLLRNWGSTTKYVHRRLGYNSRLDSLQAAVLGVKLRYLDDWNTERNRLVARYHWRWPRGRRCTSTICSWCASGDTSAPRYWRPFKRTESAPRSITRSPSISRRRTAASARGRAAFPPPSVWPTRWSRCRSVLTSATTASTSSWSACGRRWPPRRCAGGTTRPSGEDARLAVRV
jgi:hypothetical protein